MAATGSITLSESLEDYLEAIFCIIQEKQAARAKDIGKWLKVGSSSVTGALHALADRGLINYAPYDVITLTEQGAVAAQGVAKRHKALRDFFVKVLAIDAIEADVAACKMEHAVSKDILQRFVKFVKFVEECPRGGGMKWIESFEHYCNCEQCTEDAIGATNNKNIGI